MADNHAATQSSLLEAQSPDIPVAEKLAPIAIGERIEAMDILRGVALVGILLMNIEWFNRAISALGTQDTSLTGLDHAVGWLIRCFVEGKFYTLFSLLFGMGFAVMLIRAKAANRPFGAWFSRRMLVLIIFGLLHLVFLWGGDILHNYGFAGLLLIGWITLLKKDRYKVYDNPKSFFKLAVTWLSVPIVISVMAGIGFGVLHDSDSLTAQWQEEVLVAERVLAINQTHETSTRSTQPYAEEPVKLGALSVNEQAATTPTQDTVDGRQEAGELAALSSNMLIEQQAQDLVNEQQALAADAAEEVAAFTQDSYWQATEFRLDFALFIMMFTIPFSFTMLLPIFILGYWLVASGIMRNYRQHQSAFNIMAWVGIGMGAVMEVAGLLVAQHPVAMQVLVLQLVGETLFFIGQFVMTAGYFGLLMCLLSTDKWHKRLSVFSPMGRMALTNYISHSIILTSIFYGYAGGYFGEISRAPQMLIVFAIIAFQLVFSRWWLSHYAFGPLEWLWRCLSYKALQPMRLQNS